MVFRSFGSSFAVRPEVKSRPVSVSFTTLSIDRVTEACEIAGRMVWSGTSRSCMEICARKDVPPGWMSMVWVWPWIKPEGSILARKISVDPIG